MKLYSVPILIDIFTAPRKAFSELKITPRFLFPLLLIMVSYSLLYAYYFLIVDFQWMIEQMAALQPADNQEQFREAMSIMSPMIMGVSSVVGTVLSLLVIYLLYSVYLLLATKVTNDNIGFKSAFSLTCWTAMPLMLSVVASVVNITLASEGRIAIESVNPLTLDALIFSFPPDHTLKAFTSSFDILQFWSFGLLIIGFATWTDKSLGKSALIVLPPYVVIYGIWLLLAFI